MNPDARMRTFGVMIVLVSLWISPWTSCDVASSINIVCANPCPTSTLFDRTPPEDSYFLENKGQIENPDILFYTTMSPMTLAFTSRGIIIGRTSDIGRMHSQYRLSSPDDNDDLLNIMFNSSHESPPMGIDPVGPHQNYFIGNEPADWVIDVNAFRELIYRDIYLDIDMRYYFKDGMLKYDVIIGPNGECGAIEFVYDTAIHVSINESDGSLFIDTPFGGIVDAAPIAYQEQGTDNLELSCKFVLRSRSSVGFDLEDGYSSELPVIIDPGFRFCTYIGGTDDAYDRCYFVDTDKDGNVYVVGLTNSAQFPTITGSYDRTSNGNYDIFVSKFDENCSKLLYSTYIGGTDADRPKGVTVSEDGVVLICGSTESANFPHTTGAFCTTHNGGVDAFVLELNEAGSVLVFSSFIGGVLNDGADGVDWNLDGQIVVTGDTESTDFPTSDDAFDRDLNGTSDIFVLRMSADGSYLVYSTLIGGSGSDIAMGAVIDLDGCPVILGRPSDDFPVTVGACCATYREDIYGVFKFNSTQAKIVFSTFIPLGSNYEVMEDFSLDEMGNLFFVGQTASTDLPVTDSAMLKSLNGSRDGFLSVIGQNGTRIVYCSYIGSSGTDIVRAVSAHDGLVALAFECGALNYPTTSGAFDETPQDLGMVVQTIDMLDWGTTYSSFFGGSSNDEPNDIAFSADGSLLIAGATKSPNLYCSRDVFDASYGSGYDGFVLRLEPSPGVPPSPPARFTTIPSDYEVFLSWERPDNEGGCRLQGYELYRLKSDLTWSLLPYSAGLSYHDLDVENGKTYQYRVRAYSKAGMGDFASLQSTVLVKPPTPPMNLTLSTGNGTITLSWEPPLDIGGGILEGYSIHRGPLPESMTLLAEVGAVTNYTDSTVSVGTFYYYELAARNAAGIGAFSTTVRAKALAHPGPPTAFTVVAGDHQCLISWQPPQTDGGSNLAGYRLYRGMTPDATVLLATKGVGQLEHTDTPLVNGMSHFYLLTSFTEVGESTPTTIIEAIPFGLPERPSELLVLAGSGQNALSWDPPSDDGGSPILGYVILWSEVGGATGAPFRIGNTTSFVHRELSNGMTYEYRVRALNKAGEGTPSGPARGTPMGAPGIVRDMTLENAEAGVAIRWAPPVEWGGANSLSYSIMRGLSEDALVLLENLTDITEYIDYDVDVGSKYFYSVLAINAIGEGLPSGVRSLVRMVPPWPVIGFVVQPMDAKVFLQWTPPASDGGAPIMEYVILRGAFRMGLTVLHRMPSGTNYTDATVVNGQTYYYCVYAVNEEGDGNRSEVLETTPLAPPGPPSRFKVEADKDRIHLSWETPIGVGRAPVTGYRVLRGTSSTDLAVLAEVGTSMNYTDTLVEKGRTYYYSVVAQSDFGQGDAASVQEGKLKKEEDGPGLGSGMVLVAMVALAMVMILWARIKRKQ